MTEVVSNAWPKSIRLNMENRERFVRTVLEDIMPSDKQPCEDAFAKEWGDKLYADIYGPLKEHMDALPKWMWTDGSRFHVDVYKHEPPSSDYKGRDGVVEFRMTKDRRMINEENVYHWNRTGNEVMAVVPEDHEVIQAYKDHCQAGEDWNNQYQELRRTLEKVSNACNTSHQLFRAWPKAVKYAQSCFPYVEPAEAKRGGQTDISADQLNLTAKIAQATAGAVEQN